MTRTATTGGFRRMPRTYAALVAMLPPRPLHDRVDLNNAMEMIDRLAGFDLNADQEDYLEALSTFVEAYEKEHCPIEDGAVAPLEALKYLMEQRGMTASDLGRLLGNRTLGAAILSGQRALSKANVKKLAETFKVEAGLFL